MRISDFYSILELIKWVILQSEEEYLKLLKVVENNQRYDFRSYLSFMMKILKRQLVPSFDTRENTLTEPSWEIKRVFPL